MCLSLIFLNKLPNIYLPNIYLPNIKGTNYHFQTSPSAINREHLAVSRFYL